MSVHKLEQQREYTETRLELWSEYIVTSGTKGISAVPSYMRESTGEFRSTTQLPVSYDEYNEINEIVLTLHESLQQVVYLQWCELGSQEAKAKLLGISLNVFRYRLYEMAYKDLILNGL